MPGQRRLDNRGTVAIFAAVLVTILVAMADLVTEFGDALLARVDTQRVADLAAYSGALAYNANNTTAAALTAAVDLAATLNGVATSQVASSVVASPNRDGSQAVLVTVTTTVPLALSRVLDSASQLTVSTSAYAELMPSGAGTGYIIALNAIGTGATLSGGTVVSAPACAVASNNTVSVPCGTSITTILVDYNSASAPSEPCSGIQAPSGKSLSISKKSTSDPMSGNSAISTLVGHISTVAGMTSPSAPTASTGGGPIVFGYSPTSGTGSAAAQAATDGCSATFSGSTWTVTCSRAGPFNVGNITLAGGITVNFNAAGSASTTYNFNGSIYNTGSAMTFGPGTYNITQVIQTGGGTTTTFGAGTYNIGPSSTSNCSGGTFSICNSGTTLTFGGPSTFVLSSGVYNAGGSTLSMGVGYSSNSYQIGSSTGSSGNALDLGGGSKTTLGDATGSGNVFQVVGMVNVTSGGGSCLTLPAAGAHDINGNFSTAGGTNLGAGIYTISGYVALGANGGGDVTCNGSTVGMSETGVSFVISATSTPSSGTCSGQAFCLAAGYGHVTLVSPSTGNQRT
ncbi:MAG TPA: Tad domain-containing protein [Acetobacteraceae bacterium]|nr:Tad domain-containing protein [Acetobacteraceae bacterium]